VTRVRRRQLLIAAALLAAAIWAWFGSGVRTFTRPAEVLTFVPGLVVLVLTLRPSAELHRPPKTALRRTSALPWVGLAGLILVWELTELFSQPRAGHPTMSSISNALLSTRVTRFLGYLVWLAVGWMLVRDLGRRHE